MPAQSQHAYYHNHISYQYHTLTHQANALTVSCRSHLKHWKCYLFVINWACKLQAVYGAWVAWSWCLFVPQFYDDDLFQSSLYHLPQRQAPAPVDTYIDLSSSFVPFLCHIGHFQTKARKVGTHISHIKWGVPRPKGAASGLTSCQTSTIGKIYGRNWRCHKFGSVP